MYNVSEYLKYYGKYSFMEEKFNEVDNILLSAMVYIDFYSIVGNDKMTLQSIKNVYFSTKNSEIMSSYDKVFFDMASSNRFKDIILCDAVYEIDESSQFGAVIYRLPDHSLYVCFMGTDNNIVSWEENFKMNYLKFIPAQEKAINYINSNVKITDKVIRVGGHSKGGNLAIVASMYAKKWIKKRIVNIFSNDGCGLNNKLFNNIQYHEIEDKIKLFVPEESIVGMILNNVNIYKVVKSSGTGMKQHKLLNWKVYGSYLVEGHLSKSSIDFKTKLDNWLNKYDDNQKRETLMVLFNLFNKNGVKNTKEMSKINFTDAFMAIKRSKIINSESLKIMMLIFKMLFLSGSDNNDKKNKTVVGG